MLFRSETLYKRYSVQSYDDVCAMVGFGGLSTVQILNRLVEEFRKTQKPEDIAPPLPEVNKPEEQPKKPQHSSASNGVIVKGESGMLVRFARCCSPLPGDKIIGYITRGRGVSVHRADCVSLKDPGVEKDRLIEVEWEKQSGGTYEAEIRIICYNRTGLLAELSVLFASMEVPVSAISAHTLKDNTFIFNISLVIKDTQHLYTIIRELNKWTDIIEVNRVSG